MSEELERVYTSFINNQVCVHVEMGHVTCTCKQLPGVVYTCGTCMLADMCTFVQVPRLWASAAYPSLKPLSSWVKDLVLRLHFVEVRSGVH